MTTESKPLRTLEDRLASVAWHPDSPLSMAVETRQGTITTRHGHFRGGRSDGVEIIEIDTGPLIARILPTRGMSIWDLEVDGVRFGWQSPAEGPVHPSLVPTWDPSGIGWLEGFDELVVRCGLESNGAPEHDEHGKLKYPLHGRIGNLPADSLSIEFDEASGRLDVIGEIVESRLFFKRLRLQSKTRFIAGSSQVDLLDDVTNESSKAGTVQMLYHINVGAPVLGEGAVIEAPIAALAPKDDLSASEIGAWSVCGEPTPDFQERVYFAELFADDSGTTTTMLRTADKTKGLAVNFGTKTLPKFVLWKNTADDRDGYVTGLEPATNFPNRKSFEAEQGRVIELQGGGTVSFRVSLRPMVDENTVTEVAKAIAKLNDGAELTIHERPKPGWSE